MTTFARKPLVGHRVARSAALSLPILLTIAAVATPAEKAPFPRFDPERRVYVGEGVPGDYRPIEARIKELEGSTTPSVRYRVVVVRSSGAGPTATRDYADQLFDTWRDQAGSRRQTLDEARTVVIVVAIDNHQVAVRPGTALARLGMRAGRIDRDLVGPSQFAEIARQGKYPEATAALLDQTDRWIVANDPEVHRNAPEAKVAAPVAVQPPAPLRSAPVPQTRPGVAVIPPAPTASTSGGIWLGIGLLLVVAAALGGLWMWHRQNRARLADRIKEVRSRATDVMDRLDALKERLKLLPATDPDFQVPMTGETAALYAGLQDDVGKLWDRWLKVMDAVDRAQRLAVGITSPFKRKALRDAEATLDQQKLFDEIAAGVKSCADDMDRLNRSHEDARKALESAVALQPEIGGRIEAIGRLGLPGEPYREEQAAIGTEMDEARGTIAADPIGALAKLEALHSRGEVLLARTERIVGTFEESQKVSSAIEALNRQVAEHRAKGLRLAEEGGNPDATLSQAEKAHGEAAEALAAGDPDAASRAIEDARSLVDRARDIVEQVRAARDYCRREQAERLRATHRLREALPHAEESYRRLEREFAPASWEPVRTNLDQVHGLLSSFERQAAEAASAATDEAQRYLSGASTLRQLAQQQQSALRLMSAIGDKLNALSAAREDCRRRRDDLEASSRRVEDFFRRNDPVVGTMALQLLDEAHRGRDAVLSAFGSPRPDWPSVADGLTKATEGFSVAHDQAEVDVRVHQQLSDEYARARDELERVASLLSSHREDRMAANRRFRDAAEVLDRVGLDLSEPHGEWPRRLEEVRGAVADLEQAEKMAREDIGLADQARHELDDAAGAIQQVHGFGAWGISADLSAAEAALSQAEHLLASQQYERAIEGAGQAQKAARQAHQDAEQQARWHQMQQDAERRRWEGGSSMGDALTTGAAVAAGVVLGNMIQGAAEAASSQPTFDPSPAPTDTSVTDWGTDTGQSSW